MARKGSKYYQKHNVDEPYAEKEIFSAKDQALLDLIYDDLTFMKTFENLSTEDQIKAYMLLKQLSESNMQGATRTQKALIRESGYKIDKINEWAGLKKVEMLRYPLSQDEHHIIRMDCYGSIDRRPLHQLSNYYKNLSSRKIPQQLPPEAYKLDSLENAPSWQIFRQFENFRKIEPRLQNYLSEQRYDPQILKVMATKDFSDLIFQTFKTSDRDLKVSFIEGKSARNAFVVNLSNRYGDQIRRILQNENWEPRCIDSMLKVMQTYGVTDANKIIVTEKTFNDQILADLEKAIISTENYRSGEEIPQSLYDFLEDSGRLQLIQAYQENGEPLKCPHGFEVHHKVAISESGRLSSIAEVNYPNNYLLVGTKMHQNVLHLFDKLVKTNGKEAYRSRIEFINPDTAFMNGFAPNSQFAVSWEQTEDFQKRIEEDQKHIVSYDEVSEVLRKNRASYFDRKDKFDVHKMAEIVLKNLNKNKKSRRL